MSTQELLLEEIKRQPEPVLREIWHYLKFLTRQREEEAWADVLPSRDVEQEVLDILDSLPAVRFEKRLGLLPPAELTAVKTALVKACAL